MPRPIILQLQKIASKSVNRVSRVAATAFVTFKYQPWRFVRHRSWSKKAMTYARISWDPEGPKRAKLHSGWGDCQFRKMIWQKCLQTLHDIAWMNLQFVDLLNSQRGLNISQWFLMNKMIPVTSYHCHDCAMFSANLGSYAVSWGNTAPCVS